MEKNIKSIIWVIAIIFIVFLIWLVPQFLHKNSEKIIQSKTNNSLQKQGAQNIQDAPAGLATLPEDNSDGALRKDLASIDSQLQSFNAESASMGQGSNNAHPTGILPPNLSVSAIISRANKEIDQKVSDLNFEISRIKSMAKISESGRNELVLSAQNEVAELIALESTIDSESNMQSARIDYKLIAKSYGVYNFLMSQTGILIASDRALTTADSMNILGNKVRSRISGLAGPSVFAIKQGFAEFSAKVVDASVQSRFAGKEILGLQPDLGDMAKIQSNGKAFEDALAKIKISAEDLALARKDIGNIVQYLIENNNSANGN